MSMAPIKLMAGKFSLVDGQRIDDFRTFRKPKDTPF